MFSASELRLPILQQIRASRHSENSKSNFISESHQHQFAGLSKRREGEEA